MRGGTARWFLIIELLILWLSTPGRVVALAAQEQRAILSLAVNGAQHGEVSVIVRGKDVLVSISDLKAAGLKDFSGDRVDVDGTTMVSLASLTPQITYHLNEKDLALEIVANAKSFAANNLNLALAKPADLEYRDNLSAFLNYSVSETDFRGLDCFFEGGVSIKGGLLYSDLLLNGTTVIRGLTNFTYDDRTDLRRITVGDTFAGGGTLGGPVLLGGISITKNFSIDPYFVRYPTQQLSGVLTTPSMLEVYRNGILISRQEVAPGQFNLNNIPGQVGQGNTQVIIRDAFGNSRQINSPYYLSPQLLEKGLSDYSYGIGFQRSNLVDSWQYGEPALTAFHRIGLTNWLTLGGRLEGAHDSLSAGPSLSLGVLVGEIDSAFALSRSPAGNGAAGSLAYQYTTRSMSGGASVQWMSSEYWTLGLKPSQDRPVIQGLASFSLNLGFRSTLTTQYSYERFRDAAAGTQHQISATVSSRLNDKLTLIATAAAALTGSSNGDANQIFVGLSYFFGHNIVGTISADHSGDRLSAGNLGTISLQKALPVGNGIGFLLQSAEGSHQQQNAILQYQNDYGRYEADYTDTAGVSSSTLTAAGGLVAIGGRVIATRPIQDGYALIRVPELAGVPAQWSNQPMGTTDRHGDLLIPNLLPYYGNQLSITESAVPLNYVVDSDRITIAVPYRGGALVEFPVHKIQQVIGTVRIRDGDTVSVPVSGQLSVTSYAAEKVSPLGVKGEFYFENLPPGHYEASIDSKTGTCKFEIDLPKFDQPLLRLPMQYCDSSILSSAK